MKEKTTLKKLLWFELYETDAIKDYLEEMALKGWRLKAINKLYIFEKCEPQKLIYSVEIFEKAKRYDTVPSPYTLEFIDYCEAAGWEYVTSAGTLVIFVTDQENLVPIQTDQMVKYTIIKKSALKIFGIYAIIILSMIFNSSLSHDFIYTITVNSELLSILFDILVIYLGLSQFIYFVYWCNSAKKCIKAGKKIKSLNRKNIRIRTFFQLLPIFISIIFTVYSSCKRQDYSLISFMFLGFLLSFILLLIGAILAKKGYSREKNKKNIIKIMTIVILIVSFVLIPAIHVISDFEVESHCELPIKLEDLEINASSQKNTYDDVNSTFLASLSEFTDSFIYKENGKRIFLSYTIFESKIDFLINTYVSDSLNDNYTSQDNTPWGANAIYKYKKDNDEKIMVVYEDVVFIYYGNIKLDENDISYIKTALGVE